MVRDAVPSLAPHLLICSSLPSRYLLNMYCVPGGEDWVHERMELRLQCSFMSCVGCEYVLQSRASGAVSVS